jgi:hypothetical protein
VVSSPPARLSHDRASGEAREIVDLHPELRAGDEVLSTGYLADAEAALQRGEFADDYQFPADRIKEGRALVERCVGQPLGPTTIWGMFRVLEEDAGVEHQQGRSFYGLRRQATDLAPEFEQDRLRGHLDSATRKRVYQDPQNERVRARAARHAGRMRQHLVKGAA